MRCGGRRDPAPDFDWPRRRLTEGGYRLGTRPSQNREPERIPASCSDQRKHFWLGVVWGGGHTLGGMLVLSESRSRKGVRSAFSTQTPKLYASCDAHPRSLSLFRSPVLSGREDQRTVGVFWARTASDFGLWLKPICHAAFWLEGQRRGSWSMSFLFQ